MEASASEWMLESSRRLKAVQLERHYNSSTTVVWIEGGQEVSEE